MEEKKELKEKAKKLNHQINEWEEIHHCNNNNLAFEIDLIEKSKIKLQQEIVEEFKQLQEHIEKRIQKLYETLDEKCHENVELVKLVMFQQEKKKRIERFN